MASSDFRQEIANLKKAIAIAWFMNFMVLALTIEAALIVLFMVVNSSNGEIAVFIAITGIIIRIIRIDNNENQKRRKQNPHGGR